ncbi:FAD-dependent monooxygenase [Nocardia sp. NPDC046473]|uniref:FAD-dependent monooxygenase n=1 Tax=Nocardia sp. NPDC046473 TaxID=3155733 RepID=UPI0033F8F921
MDHTETDFCVVGGGPAGLTMALLLLRSGVRVTVIERSRTLEREYRGEILQPGALALLDQLGVLAGARERGCYELARFQLIERGDAVLDIDYRKLPKPYNYLLSIPQQHLLAELLVQCGRYEHFRYLAGKRVTDLVTEGGQVRGVVYDSDQESSVRAHCVIGADGRYSRVRRRAEIDNLRQEVFDLDVLWFKLPIGDTAVPNAQIFRGGGNPVLVYKAYPGKLQLGWTLPHGGYRAIADQGVEQARARIGAAIPPFADLIDEHIVSMRDFTLLDVFAAKAQRWVRDGVVLIGDSAHTHSPLGAQGINLAIQDAVVAHPVLMESLHRKDATAEFLEKFVRIREPDINRVMKTQVMQSKGMLSRDSTATVVRHAMIKIMQRTPVFKAITRQIAVGNPAITVASNLFTAD